MMKYAILYSSQTGNTKQLADTLSGLLGNEARQQRITPDMAVPQEKVLLIGYWVDKGTCPREVRQLLEKLEGKQILFFATAGFGQTKDYFEQIALGIEQLACKKNQVLGSFFCQGRMPAGIRERYEKVLADCPQDEKAKLFLENYDLASTHPDAGDLKELLDYASARLPMESAGRGVHV